MTRNLKVRKSHILPWENVAELFDECASQVPAERHLVKEIDGIIWRK